MGASVFFRPQKHVYALASNPIAQGIAAYTLFVLGQSVLASSLVVAIILTAIVHGTHSASDIVVVDMEDTESPASSASTENDAPIVSTAPVAPVAPVVIKATITLKGFLAHLRATNSPMFPTSDQWLRCAERVYNEARANGQPTPTGALVSFLPLPALGVCDGVTIEFDRVDDGQVVSSVEFAAVVGDVAAAAAHLRVTDRVAYELLLWIHHHYPGNENYTMPFLHEDLIDAAMAEAQRTLFFSDEFVARFKSEILMPHTYHDLPMTGAVLYGLAGTGKSKLLQSLSKHLPVRFQSFSSGDFMKSLVGKAEEALKATFQEPLQNPHVLHFYLFDEGESLMCKRDTLTNGSHMLSIISTILTCMDGVFKGKLRNLSVFTATNYKLIIDEAFLRPGRFTVSIQFALPDAATRTRILCADRELLFPADVLAKLVEYTMSTTPAELVSMRAWLVLNRRVQPGANRVAPFQIDWDTAKKAVLRLSKEHKLRLGFLAKLMMTPVAPTWVWNPMFLWIAVKCNSTSGFKMSMYSERGVVVYEPRSDGKTFPQYHLLHLLCELARKAGCNSFRMIGSADVETFLSGRSAANTSGGIAEYVAKEVVKAKEGGSVMVAIDLAACARVESRSAGSTAGGVMVYSNTTTSYDLVDVIPPDFLGYLKSFIASAVPGEFVPVLIAAHSFRLAYGKGFFANLTNVVPM